MQYSDDLRDLTGVRGAGSAVPVVERVCQRSLGARQRLPSARFVRWKRPLPAARAQAQEEGFRGFAPQLMQKFKVASGFCGVELFSVVVQPQLEKPLLEVFEDSFASFWRRFLRKRESAGRYCCSDVGAESVVGKGCTHGDVVVANRLHPAIVE